MANRVKLSPIRVKILVSFGGMSFLICAPCFLKYYRRLLAQNPRTPVTELIGVKPITSFQLLTVALLGSPPPFGTFSSL